MTMNADIKYPLYETTVFENFRVMVENVARKYPDRIAYSYKKDPHDTKTVDVTFSEVRDYVRNMGTELIALGCTDKKVAIVGETSLNWICSYFALIAIGAIVVPIDKDMPLDELTGILDFAECEYIVYSTAVEEKIMQIGSSVPTLKTYICMGEPKMASALKLSDLVEKGKERFENGDNSYYDYEIDPDRLATIVFTSGTTGKSKGVMLSQRNIASDMTQGMYLFAITPKTMAVLPPHHTYCSTVVFVGHFAQGCTTFICSGLKYS